MVEVNMDKDETSSIATVSSSGIMDSKVTILRDPKDNTLALEIEKELKENGQSIAISLCAGRTVIQNLFSRKKHAASVIILLSKAAENYLEGLEPLQLQFERQMSTLILYEAGFNLKSIKRHYEHLVKIQRRVAPIEIAQQIMLFLDAQHRQDHIPPSITELKRHFIDNLIHVLLSPSLAPAQINVKELKKIFEEKYCSYTNLNEGEFESHFNNNPLFSLKDGYVMMKPVHSIPSDKNAPTSVSDLDVLSETESTIEEGSSFQSDKQLASLSKQHGSLDERYSFFLISGRHSHNSSDDLIKLLNVPWLRIFDFDANSRCNGILSLLETKLKERRTLSISSGNNVVELSTRATDWCFPLGTSDEPDTLLGNNVMEWYSSNLTTLEKQFKQIASFCTAFTTPVVIILWYSCSEIQTRCLDWCLGLLYTKVPSKLLKTKVILCTDQDLKPTNMLQQVVDKYQLDTTTYTMALSTVCTWLGKAKFFKEVNPCTVQLPSANGSGTPAQIATKDAAWIGKLIEMVPFDFPTELLSSAAHESTVTFLKGGTVHWRDLFADNKAVLRDSQKMMQIESLLENDILKDRKSLVINIWHEPGGGGTTMGRQVLWAMHRRIPCGVVLSSDLPYVNEIADRVKFLQEKTSLPIVLLVDGRSDKEVSLIMETCMYGIIIVHVQRFNSNKLVCDYDQCEHLCTLPGHVSYEEAVKFSSLYTTFVPQKASALIDLTTKARQEPCYVFEYGLTAFNFKFKGIHNFVRGYLQITPNTSIMDLPPWQKVLAHLSLTLYYGQTGLPCEVFRNVLNVQSGFVTMSHMASSACEQFISSDKVFWQIRYYPMAKEVLEQVLNYMPIPGEYENGDLSSGACSNLHHLVIEFIWILRDAVQNERPPKMLNLLTTILIRRDKRGKDKRWAYGKQCPLSRLLEHVPDSDNRIKILQEVTRAFPDFYEFQAHLGRLYSILNRFGEAESSLDMALAILKENERFEENKPNDALGRIHNMFGYACLKRVKYLLKNVKEKSSLKVVDVLEHVSKALYHFGEGRKYITYNFSYSYIGEIKTRLAITKHVSNNFPGGCLKAKKEGWGTQFIRLQNFVRESHYASAYLLDECYYYTPQKELKEARDFDRCKGDFIFCFGDLHFGWQEFDSISVRRSKIASLKVIRVNNTDHYFSNVGRIRHGRLVSQIIDLHEKNIEEALYRGKYLNITIDVLEWLDAIRHKNVAKDYGLEERVLPFLRDWDSRNESVHSTYYHYIVTFILSVYTLDENRRREHISTSKRLRENLRNQRKRYIYKPLNQEVLVKYDKLTIRKLLCADQIGSSGKGKDYWAKHTLVKWFQVYTGTITSSELPRSGIISLNTSTSRQHQVDVFFVPIEYNLVGKRFSDEKTKVEFFIRFSVERGAEAIALRKLEKETCSACHKTNYIVTLNHNETICTSCVGRLSNTGTPTVAKLC